ncbi:hypothetical protein [Bacillus cereus]|uniref:hypothetical protein n=1 Tax=Bacillus cereus TaxID=1396 RepID=UPI000BFC273D|nr:hypothetical protein [Bacillus cereus]PGZ14687.1 hypothetical protein COE46_17835 [Bacillus cereus]
MLTPEDCLLIIGEKAELIHKLSMIAHSLRVDELYHKEHAADELMKIIKQQVSDMPVLKLE